jgi:hypothetical protein
MCVYGFSGQHAPFQFKEVDETGRLFMKKGFWRLYAAIFIE